jgi:sulfite reductase beta subunit-like hemoprotein
MDDTATLDYRTLKINGVYQQNAAGDLMIRAKLPAGILSAAQVEAICDVSDGFSDGMLHLTCRGNIEIHGVQGEDLPQVFRCYRAVGLTTRGACGGAVRSVVCATSGGQGFARLQMLVRVLHEHFTGNPYFEGLPKKIKLAVENGYQGARHLCQDLVMVYLGNEDGRDLCDVWVAGGLGRQPQEGFLLAGRVPFERLIPLIEGVIKVYQKHAPAGKRLKHLLGEIGEKEFRALLAAETGGIPVCPVASPFDDALGEASAPGAFGWIEVPIFAGQLSAADLRQIAAVARQVGDGFVAVSRDQNLLVSLGAGVDSEGVKEALQAAGYLKDENPLQCRACPGTHGCPKGLVATRDVARLLEENLSEKGKALEWAVSGCPNSCSQPQLADFGIIGVRKGADAREALYDLYKRDGEGFGQVVREKLTLDELMGAVKELV